MVFTFTLNASRAFRCADAGASLVGADMNDRISMALDTEGDIPSAISHMMPELLRKWGLGGMQLRSFRFDTEKDDANPSPLYHQGMAHELIKAFLNDPDVLKALCVPPGKSTVSLGDAASRVAVGETLGADIEPLNCSLTSLSFLNRLLHCRDIVRNPPALTPETSSSDINKVFKYPIVRQMDVFLPCGVTVSDALREYVMLPDDTYCENRNRLLDEELAQNGTAPEGDTDLTEGREYPLISPDHRKEFLFHVFWRLVSGGSPLCQFEEDAIYYKMGARELYKDIVCVGRRKAVDSKARPELLVQSNVFAIKSIFGDSSKKELPLFPFSDDVSPSNSNFAYVIVNPSRREIVWWYNAFTSF